MSLQENDAVMENLAEYLDDKGTSLEEILKDEKGYYFIDEQDFTDSEGGEVIRKKVYLPAEFQELNLI